MVSFLCAYFLGSRGLGEEANWVHVCEAESAVNSSEFLVIASQTL